ncbi:MAG: response regulator [Bacteroidales bacterium]|nr:response regulator [Bacteroidales bacterium]
MNSGRILIADDVTENRILLSKILSKLGYEFDVAIDGDDCYNKFTAGNYDLVFIDIKMPGMDGIEVTKKIRSEMPFPKNRTKIVAITAYKYREFFEDFHDVGFNDIISKPYTAEKVSNVINYQKIISTY